MQPPAAEMFPPAERRGRIFIPRKSFSASSLSLRILPCQRFHSCRVKWGCGVTHRFPSMVRSLNYKALNYLCYKTLRVYSCKQNIIYIMYFVTCFPLKKQQHWPTSAWAFVLLWLCIQFWSCAKLSSGGKGKHRAASPARRSDEIRGESTVVKRIPWALRDVYGKWEILMKTSQLCGCQSEVVQQTGKQKWSWSCKDSSLNLEH